MTEFGDGAYDAQEWLPVLYDPADLDPEATETDEGDGGIAQDFVDAQLPILRDYEEGEEDDLVPPYAHYPVPRPQEIVRRGNDVQLPEKQGILSIYTDDTEKHRRHYKVRPGPDGKVDANRLLLAYFESLRTDKTYPHEVIANQTESEAVDRYGKAQLHVARQLKIPEAVAYKVDHTPWHVFTNKKHADDVISGQMGAEWVTNSRGIYTPVTGVVWVRSSDPEVVQSGIARMVVESSAAALTLPADSSPQKAIGSTPYNNRRAQSSDLDFEVMLAHGYDRRDILPRPDCLGLHMAVGDMATLRVMREGNYQGRSILSTIGINVVLDAVIRVTAKRQGEDVRTVADDLLKGYYTGHLNGLNRVTDALGRAGAYCFLTLNGQEKERDIHRIAAQLEIPEIAHTYRHLAQGGKGRLYRW